MTFAGMVVPYLWALSMSNLSWVRCLVNTQPVRKMSLFRIISISAKIRGSSLNLLVQCGFLFSSLSACQTGRPLQWRWERAEAGLPRQAIITSVAADHADPDRLWVGYYAPGGLATSLDGGQTWAAGATGLGDNPVFDLMSTFSSERDQERLALWAATRDGLLRSPDAGVSWQRVNDGLPSVTAFDLAIDAAGRLYVGLDNAGVYAQTEDGWRSLTPAPLQPPAGDAVGGELLASAAVLSLAVSADGQQLYAGTAAQGVFASPDGGRTWLAHYPGEYAPNVALNPTKPTEAVTSLRTRLIRTQDGGQSWHALSVPWSQDEVVSLLWLPDGTLGAGTGKGRLYRSSDGGSAWVEGGEGLSVSGGVLALGVTPARQFLAGTWTGVYGSSNGGETWAELAPSLGVPHANTLLSGEATLLLGTRTGLFKWVPDAAAWEPAPAHFPPGGIQSLAADLHDPQILYAGTAGDGLYRSDNAGLTWQRLPSLGVGIPAMAIDPGNGKHLYILAAWERVYESKDGGQTWQANWNGLGDTLETVSVAVDNPKTGGSTVFVGAETGLYRSRNHGDWESVARSLLDQSVLALMIQPIPPESPGDSMLYLGTTRGAYRSLDAGKTVQSCTHATLGWGCGLENISVTAFLANPEDPLQLFAGTAYEGIFQSSDGGHTWQPIGPTGLVEDVVEDLAWGPDGELFIAAASGVWRGKTRQ